MIVKISEKFVQLRSHPDTHTDTQTRTQVHLNYRHGSLQMHSHVRKINGGGGGGGGGGG